MAQLVKPLASAALDPRLSKRSVVVKNALRQHGSAGSASASSRRQQYSLGKSQIEVDDQGAYVVGGSDGDCECWYTQLVPRRPKTSGSAGSRLECRLYAVACSRRQPFGTQQDLQAELKHRAATPASRGTAELPLTSGQQAQHGSTAVPLESIAAEDSSFSSSTDNSTPPALRAALQAGQCLLECDMSESIKSDLSPAVLHRKYKDKGFQYGQIKLALTRHQVLEGAAIRDPLTEDTRGPPERSQLRLGGLHGSMPNIAFAAEAGIPPLPAQLSPVRSHHRSPLLVSGIFHIADDGSNVGKIGNKELPAESTQPVRPAAGTAPGGGGGGTGLNSTDFINWQQVLGPQRIPTVTKPPVMNVPATAAVSTAATISLPQRRTQARMAGSQSGYSSGGSANGAGTGLVKASRRPDSSHKREVEPKYADPFAGAPASVQTRLAELAALESETVRWERAIKIKKKAKDRDD